MFVLLISLSQQPCVEAKARTPLTADTALFVDVDSRGYSVKSHGDTVWSITPKGTVRVIETGDWLQFRVTSEDGKIRDSEYCVKGDVAVPISTDPKAKPVDVSTFRHVKELVESTKRMREKFSRVPK